jgi:hypothetical protein
MTKTEEELTVAAPLPVSITAGERETADTRSSY